MHQSFRDGFEKTAISGKMLTKAIKSRKAALQASGKYTLLPEDINSHTRDVIKGDYADLSAPISGGRDVVRKVQKIYPKPPRMAEVPSPS